jgi:RNA polymerase-binding transcription factor DksA
MNDLAGVRAELEARLRALSAQIDRIEEEQRAPLGDDFSDQAVAREDDEALDGIERGAMDDMARTRQAIARIDAGTYGLCVACGGRIAQARLAALPTAPHCIDCARDAQD